MFVALVFFWRMQIHKRSLSRILLKIIFKVNTLVHIHAISECSKMLSRINK